VLALPSPAAAQCTVSASGVSFGSYDVFAPAPRDSSGSVTYECLVVVTVQITLSRGSAPTFTPRTLVQGAETLQYNLYLDNARSTVWGDGSGGTSVFTRTLALGDVGQTVVVPVYGRIPARQDVSAGAYNDSITVTINF
jgi:spore coat protein U-like protein